MNRVGFEPTSTNTDDLKSSPLDRSGTIPPYYINKLSLNQHLKIL